MKLIPNVEKSFNCRQHSHYETKRNIQRLYVTTLALKQISEAHVIHTATSLYVSWSKSLVWQYLYVTDQYRNVSVTYVKRFEQYIFVYPLNDLGTSFKLRNYSQAFFLIFPVGDPGFAVRANLLFGTMKRPKKTTWTKLLSCYKWYYIN